MPQAATGRRDAAEVVSPFTESNRRPSPYHGDALPTELKGPDPIRADVKDTQAPRDQRNRQRAAPGPSSTQRGVLDPGERPGLLDGVGQLEEPGLVAHP